MSTTTTRMALVLVGAIALGGAALAQGMQKGTPKGTPGAGPIATACAADIAKHCTGKEHAQGEARACLTAAKDKVSAACKTALDTTGPGKGGGPGAGKGMQKGKAN